ncbi:MAG: elongation factor P maturation arginine rhamnosyltransferase EarP [Gallionella sp.]|nr:elongation factor P maturation arginine rhamnosyltransferase EarP [Gallionella sp.]
MRSESCDIFCNVIDNFGDIGVCWRLARQLANEHGLAVRLWVDDLGSLSKLCPEADVALQTQRCRGVEVCHWAEEAFHSFPYSQTLSRPIGHPLPLAGEGLGERGVADLVIEAFACKLPQSYIKAMAAQEHKPVWINLEYLSAEEWVESHHKLPSPHPNLPLTKYFFFPGFTKQTGGLLLERDLLARRDAFQNDTAQQQEFWLSLGMEVPSAETLKISLFAYENVALHGLFDAWSGGTQPVLCLVPEGRILPQVRQYFGDVAPCVGKVYSRGNLRVRVLPFVEQERYDELLWACDVNFVRGEDSCVRAQWAGRPFIWQIYPQHDTVHLDKLQAFLNLYNAPLSATASEAVQSLWQAWNRESGAGQATSTGSGQAWSAFIAVRGELERHAQHWARQLAGNNLALNLLDFSQKIGRMHAFKIEGQ